MDLIWNHSQYHQSPLKNHFHSTVPWIFPFNNCVIVWYLARKSSPSADYMIITPERDNKVGSYLSRTIHQETPLWLQQFSFCSILLHIWAEGWDLFLPEGSTLEDQPVLGFHPNYKLLHSLILSQFDAMIEPVIAMEQYPDPVNATISSRGKDEIIMGTGTFCVVEIPTWPWPL